MGTTFEQMTTDEYQALVEGTEPIRESMFQEFYEECYRCAGAGYIAAFGYWDAGICYGCHGARGKMVSAKTQAGRARTDRRRVREAAQQAAREEQERQERDVKRAEWKAANNDVVEALETMKGNFAQDMRDSIQYRGSLTEKQAAAVRRIAQENAERAQKAVEVPTGREVITGKILTVKRRESDYGITYRATIEDDRGFRVNGNLPGAIIDQFFTMWQDEHNKTHATSEDWTEIAQGARITFTATLEPKETGFGFWKRPARASIR